VTAAVLIDATRPLGPATPAWPGDRAFRVEQEREGTVTVSTVTLSCHLGTHLEAPCHVDPVGAGVERISLERLHGPAEVVALPAAAVAIGADALPGWRPSCPRVLFRTDRHALDQPIGPGFPGLAPGFAAWLAEAGVDLIGVDTPSVDPFESTALTAHHELAAAGIAWIEGLWLGDAPPGRYRLLALPLAVVGVDAAPLRVVLEPLA
jgi:arylformamidase